MSSIMPQNKVEIWSEMVLAKTVYILISGKAGAGKSTLALFINKCLSEKGYQVVKTSFAHSVKNCAVDYFYWDGEKDDKGRKLLQGIGNLGREYYEDNWVISTVYYVEDTHPLLDFVIVDDWRFPNEAKYFEDRDMYQLYKIKVVGSHNGKIENEELKNDISEISLDDYNDFNLVVDNTSSIEELENLAKKFVNEILTLGE